MNKGMSKKIKDITGNKYNRLLVLSFNSLYKNNAIWNCLCDCGNKVTVKRYSLISGHTKSCGCLKKDIEDSMRTKNGLSSTRAYSIWKRMNDRCLNKGHSKYKYYGGRGITICNEWSDFEKFFLDMGECPDGFQIDRIDNNKGYGKENCRWVARKDQMNNKRNNRILYVDGIKLTMTQASEIFGVGVGTIWRRLELGWSDDAAAKTKVKTRCD